MPRKRPAPALADLPGYVETRLVDPRELLPLAHPENAHTHGPEQLATLRQLIERNGWVIPVIVNQATNRLVDGHALVPLAVDMGLTTVPCAFGRWTEAQERELLALLDASGLQAGYDPAKLADLRGRLDPQADALRNLLDRVQGDPALRAGLASARAVFGATPDAPAVLYAEPARLDSLKPHPRNYQSHPDDQLDHLVASLRANGLYRPVLVARDDTILAGHGLCLAAARAGLQMVPVIRLDLDPADPRALRLLAADNEMGGLGERDDRALSELLKEIHERAPDGLLGTGFDPLMLSGLVMVTRPESEIRDKDNAADWVGMPEYENPELTIKLVLSFRAAADRDALVRQLGLKTNRAQGSAATALSAWWPPRENDDLGAVKFEG